jgi:hypothetical protein
MTFAEELNKIKAYAGEGVATDDNGDELTKAGPYTIVRPCVGDLQRWDVER